MDKKENKVFSDAINSFVDILKLVLRDSGKHVRFSHKIMRHLSGSNQRLEFMEKGLNLDGQSFILPPLYGLIFNHPVK